MTQSECEAEGLFALVAGSETTASVIRVTMLCLMSSPPIYYKFKEMIREAVASGAVSSPITVAEARKLPYLQAVIYEGLRIRSPATGLYPKKVPAGGDVILGHYVPGGTSIGMNLPSLLKKQDIFGADADVFRPERFLEADPETRTRMEREVEMVFGHGRYMCGGKPIAFMELYKVFFEVRIPPLSLPLPGHRDPGILVGKRNEKKRIFVADHDEQMLRHFDFQIINPQKPWKSRSYSKSHGVFRCHSPLQHMLTYVQISLWKKITLLKS